MERKKMLKELSDPNVNPETVEKYLNGPEGPMLMRDLALNSWEKMETTKILKWSHELFNVYAYNENYIVRGYYVSDRLPKHIPGTILSYGGFVDINGVSNCIRESYLKDKMNNLDHKMKLISNHKHLELGCVKGEDLGRDLTDKEISKLRDKLEDLLGYGN